MFFPERSKDYLQMIHAPAMVVYRSVFPKRDLWTVNLSAASEIFICSRVGQLLILENVIPPLMGNPSNGHINPTIGLMTIPYHKEPVRVWTRL